ncbi:hypothetical protein BO79DRAFT_210141 [Aspergillus costaricaensis CBS 115574]|uniref:Uncharacterized protein n=1 Tax=Aspergillus costaricaensis CBS 115574 TaxID=1448317 RepID=A0ACD1I8U8_9EURO|nr:hypothetical protein BO79DRAFT_210141 [Aspergillus costaricaensis CBS 115574]RAK86651.1 hypothetical protein BO79DRAFT_210141 [Aspergillus costaricaensis CBS 115574]
MIIPRRTERNGIASPPRFNKIRVENKFTRHGANEGAEPDILLRLSPAGWHEEMGLNHHRSLYRLACKRAWLSNCRLSDQVRNNEASLRWRVKSIVIGALLK